MKPFAIRRSLVIAACLGSLFAVSGAQARESILEHMARMHSPADEYFLFEQDRKQVADFKTDHIVRICTGESRHLVPLAVHYDGNSATVASGDCIRVEARKIELQPAKLLDPNFVIEARVKTIE